MRVGGLCVPWRVGLDMPAMPKSDERGAEGTGSGPEADSDEVATRGSH
jgi:hypothetical protein